MKKLTFKTLAKKINDGEVELMYDLRSGRTTYAEIRKGRRYETVEVTGSVKGLESFFGL